SGVALFHSVFSCEKNPRRSGFVSLRYLLLKLRIVLRVRLAPGLVRGFLQTARPLPWRLACVARHDAAARLDLTHHGGEAIMVDLGPDLRRVLVAQRRLRQIGLIAIPT